MIKIDFDKFFHEHIIFGFYPAPMSTADDEDPGPITIWWQWGWKGTVAGDVCQWGNPPWHRCWRHTK